MSLYFGKDMEGLSLYVSGDGAGTSGLGPAHDLDGPEDPRQETGEEQVRQA